MQYKFPYINGRPAIMAKLGINEESSRYFEFLVDSGADFTIISKSSAIYLGIDYENIQNDEIKVEVANLTYIKTKKIIMKLGIEGHFFDIPVLIANQEVESLLGRKGIFEFFDILIQEYDKLLTFIKR